MNKTQVDKYFATRTVKGEQLQFNDGFRKIHYIKSGNEAKPLVVFIHGSPGSSSAFIHFLADSTLNQEALLISTDRPGFGYSNIGYPEPDLQKQAELLKHVIERHKNINPVILVGHSMGGPVAARMAMDYPELIDGLVIVAGAVDPALEPSHGWIRGPLASPFLNWVLPPAIHSSNKEIYRLKPELQKMIPLWNQIVCPVIVIQGKKDNLVPYGNLEFAKKMLVSTNVECIIKDDMNHFVPWTNPELIQQAILRLLHKKTDLQAQIVQDKNILQEH